MSFVTADDTMMAGAIEDIMTSSSKSRRSTADIHQTKLPVVCDHDIPTVPDLCPGAQPTGDDPVQYYAIAISAGWQKSVRSILETSKHCADASASLDPVQRKQLIDSLPFDRTVFDKLVGIGRCPALHEPEVESSLPPNWTILNIARNLTPSELTRAISEKVIAPQTNRKNLQQWMARNSRWGKPKPLDELALAKREGQAGEVRTLKTLWDASPELANKFLWSASAVRTGFIKEIMKGRKIAQR